MGDQISCELKDAKQMKELERLVGELMDELYRREKDFDLNYAGKRQLVKRIAGWFGVDAYRAVWGVWEKEKDAAHLSGFAIRGWDLM